MARAGDRGPIPRGSSEIWNRQREVLRRQLAQFGGQLRRVRHDLDLTQEEAAESIGIHAKTLARIERGQANPTVATIFAIARAYKVDVVEFFNQPTARRGRR